MTRARETSAKRVANSANSPLHEDTRHLHELERALAILQSLGQVQNLSSEHRHLLLKHGAVIALVGLDRKDC